jgi:hypothetical protein
VENLANIVQAISSIITVLVTVALAIITANYVKLTKRIADLSESQFDFQQQSETVRKNELSLELKSYALFFKKLIEPLPFEVFDNGKLDKCIRGSIVWSNKDVYKLQKLASFLSEGKAEDAAEISTALRFIKGKIDEVKIVPPLLGYSYTDFPWAVWVMNIKLVNEKLDIIINK